ncbi:uncharacterized protein [Spinacia oleracea]|uniref:Integrase catalytic domain-containing protein n=1 Tax=Spinacia oleracea TaxID=3562 RepID=A0ABM3QXS3_SPIOL|nr:uncharacterized protein LOC130463147 [Spinacia oleracea]
MMKFLLGMNRGFDGTVKNVLSMDPLPSINRVFSITQQIEKQKELSNVIIECNAMNSSAMAVQAYRRGQIQKYTTGYDGDNGVLSNEMLNAICQEVMKVMKGKQPQSTDAVDSGACDQMTYDETILTNIRTLINPIKGFRHNLLSIGRLIQHIGVKFISTGTGYTLQDPASSELIGAGKRTNGLSEYNCVVCYNSKHHKLPFAVSTSRADVCFDLIHLDLRGPYRVRSFDGASFFLIVFYDHSRTTWTYLIHNKLQVEKVVSGFLSMVETQFDTKVKRIRSDHGTEIVKESYYFLPNSLFYCFGFLHGIRARISDLR